MWRSILTERVTSYQQSLRPSGCIQFATSLAIDASVATLQCYVTTRKPTTHAVNSGKFGWTAKLFFATLRDLFNHGGIPGRDGSLRFVRRAICRRPVFSSGSSHDFGSRCLVRCMVRQRFDKPIQLYQIITEDFHHVAASLGCRVRRLADFEHRTFSQRKAFRIPRRLDRLCSNRPITPCKKTIPI